jgi:ribonuclease BN (tRNA processing enzyme)
VYVGLSDGTHLILDAGTGMRNLPNPEAMAGEHVHILLTHLHLDHIQGLLFFAPLFDAHARVTIWGPAAPGVSLRNRLARYLSAPLTPVDIRELPCELDFRRCPHSEWDLGSARIRAEAVTHRGPTLGFRIEEDDTSLCYLPDHEPALIESIDRLDTEWISGYSLARGASLLIHDAQYTDAEYPSHRGWGHSAISHTVQFADRCDVRQTLLFHHDPGHSDDQLDAALDEAREHALELGGDPQSITMASDGAELLVPA